jgi:glyoxylase-like metal-dependent hydrolase (beta-lactamase superfamily II)
LIGMTGTIPFTRELTFEYGRPEQVSPLVRRVVAGNPSVFTLYGTGTYVVGRGTVAVIDPGPALGSHLDALACMLAGETVAHILVTHTHVDHSPLARPLQHLCGAPISGFRAATRRPPKSKKVEIAILRPIALFDMAT